jgi:hypothetical protein
MKQLENSMEIHEVYLGMFDMCSISYPVEHQGDIQILSMYDATVTRRPWLSPVNFTLEGAATTEVGTSGLLHIP